MNFWETSLFFKNFQGNTRNICSKSAVKVLEKVVRYVQSQPETCVSVAYFKQVHFYNIVIVEHYFYMNISIA